MIIVNKIDAENVDLAALLAQHPGGVRQGMPADQPAGATAARRRRLLLQPVGRVGFLLGRGGAPRAHRPGGRGRRGADGASTSSKGEVEPEQLHAPFEKALREGHLVPVCFVSARNGAGVTELLDVFVKLLPNPDRRQPAAVRARARATKAERVHARAPDPKKHVLAHVFKVVDRSVRRASSASSACTRARSPRTPSSSSATSKKPFKVGHLFLLQGKDHVETPTRSCRATSARSPRSTRSTSTPCCTTRTTRTTSTCGRSSSRRRCTASRSSRRSAATSRGSPTRCTSSPPRTRRFRVEHDPTTHETVMRGLGDLHLRYDARAHGRRSTASRSTRKPPRIPYRETDHREGRRPPPAQEADRRRGPVRRGVPQGRAARARRRASSSSTQVKGGVDPDQFIPAVEKGVRAGARPRARSPAIRCRTCA